MAMLKRQKWHVEPEKGWINDPNGLCWFKGQYHAFTQHNPHAPVWDTMYWGHAVSDDLLHWKELPIALYPDAPYENTGGCFSGSAVVKDDVLYLIYTAVSGELGQTQCVAMSTDGVHFEKYAGNPVIDHYPAEGSRDFRDPKVILLGNTYHMVLASGKNGVAKVLHYTSADLLHWEYAGVLFEAVGYGSVFECPDLFPLGQRWVLKVSTRLSPAHREVFIVGDFDGERFTPVSRQIPEGGHFYASQSFEAPDGRRILFGWMSDPKYVPQINIPRAGSLSLPRELSLDNGRLICAPVREALPLLSSRSDCVRVDAGSVTVKTYRDEWVWHGDPRSVQILEDSRTLEVFINGGEGVISTWK